jgi:hypothetical protein
MSAMERLQIVNANKDVPKEVVAELLPRRRAATRAKAADETKAPTVSRRLDLPESWLKELSKLYREARKGDTDVSEVTKLAFVAREASKLAKEISALRKLDLLREQLKLIGIQVGEDGSLDRLDVEVIP